MKLKWAIIAIWFIGSVLMFSMISDIRQLQKENTAAHARITEQAITLDYLSKRLEKLTHPDMINRRMVNHLLGRGLDD